MRIENAQLQQIKPKYEAKGTLEIDRYKLTFSTKDSKLEYLHQLLQEVVLKECLYIYYRHFICIKLMIPQQEMIFQELQKHIDKTTVDDLYCFVNPERYQTSWNVYDIKQDAKRMGLSEKWRISTINQDYQFSPTYPQFLIVPQRISDNTLKHIGKFRSKARIPALSYIHSNQCTITRSAQPMIGLKQNKNIQDEKLIEAIFNSTKVEKECLILDARPLTNAMAQTAMGAGTESKSDYKNCDIVFLGIENIHVVRDSFTKLYDGSFL
jgi:hypothetical protein